MLFVDCCLLLLFCRCVSFVVAVECCSLLLLCGCALLCHVKSLVFVVVGWLVACNVVLLIIDGCCLVLVVVFVVC